VTKKKKKNYAQSNCCYEYGQDGHKAMFRMPWQRQPCRDLSENEGSSDSLDEKANDTRAQNVGLTSRVRCSGGHISHDGAIPPASDPPPQTRRIGNTDGGRKVV